MKSKNYLFPLFSLALFTLSCGNDPEQTGCTDPLASNYAPAALKDDESCTYNEAEQLIWADGVRGGWNGDLQQGAFRMVACQGDINEMITPRDSTELRSLQFATGTDSKHLSYFSILNERNARDFAEGTMRMDVRLIDLEGGSPDYIRLFISGKNWQYPQCEPFRRSDYVEISTHSFTDSTFTEVSIPIRHFSDIIMARVNVVCGLSFESDRNTAIEVNNIRWVANKL